MVQECPPPGTEPISAEDHPAHGSPRGFRLIVRRVQRALTANLLLKTISFVIALALYSYYHRSSVPPPAEIRESSAQLPGNR
jgi:hypothetical protein